ncbi:MAG: hypothetical protein ABL974_15975 [Prosthecobacter sp.]
MAFVILISSFGIPVARAHPSDISYLRVKVERQRVEMRFTFNLLSLSRFVPGLDASQNRHIDKAELEAAAIALNDYFNQHIEVNINEKKATLGHAGPFECVWPVIDGSDSVAEADYPVRYVDITFTQTVKPLLADVWLGFDIWQQTGPLGTIEATFEQDDLRMQVPFSVSEPDYLYDTGYAVEAVFQEVAALPVSDRGWVLWVAAAGIGLTALIATVARLKAQGGERK